MDRLPDRKGQGHCLGGLGPSDGQVGLELIASMTLPACASRHAHDLNRQESCFSDWVPWVTFIRHHDMSGDARLREFCVLIAWPGSYVLS